MDSAITRQIVAGTALQPDSLSFAGGSAGINGVSIFNQSPLSIGLYIGAGAPAGNPDITIAPYTYQGVPIANAAQVCVAYNGVPTVSGSVYLHYTSDNVSAFVFQIPQNELPTKTPWTITQPVSLTPGNSGDTALISQIFCGATSNIGIFTPSQVVYLTDVYIEGGGDFQRIYWQVNATNPRTGYSSGPLYVGRGRAARVFGTPVPVYFAARNGAIVGDGLSFWLSASEAYTAPLNSIVHLVGYSQ